MSDCIIFPGCKHPRGYGKIKYQGKAIRAHRYVMAMEHGWEAIEGKVILHLCDNPSCVNLEHLRIGTQQDNIKMAGERGHMSRTGPRRRTKATKEPTP